MNNYKIEYYFNNIEEFKYYELFSNCVYPWEALANVKNLIQKLVQEENVKINKGTIGDFVSIEGNYIIEEGTKIHSNVSIEGPVIIGKNCEIRLWSINKTMDYNWR